MDSRTVPAQLQPLSVISFGVQIRATLACVVRGAALNQNQIATLLGFDRTVVHRANCAAVHSDGVATYQHYPETAFSSLGSRHAESVRDLMRDLERVNRGARWWTNRERTVFSIRIETYV